MFFPLFGWFCAAAQSAQKLLREVKSVILFHGDFLILWGFLIAFMFVPAQELRRESMPQPSSELDTVPGLRRAISFPQRNDWRFLSRDDR